MENLYILDSENKLFDKLSDLIFQNLKYKIDDRLILVYCHDKRLIKELKKLPIIETLGVTVYPTVKSYNNGNQCISIQYRIGNVVVNVLFILTTNYLDYLYGKVFQSAIILNTEYGSDESGNTIKWSKRNKFCVEQIKSRVIGYWKYECWN